MHALPPQLPAIASGQHGLFTTAQARASGYTYAEIGRLVGRHWRALRRGVYVDRGRYDALDERGRHRLGVHALLLNGLGRRRGQPCL
jgi:hypothetical protein